jgi:cytochrome c5
VQPDILLPGVRGPVNGVRQRVQAHIGALGRLPIICGFFVSFGPEDFMSHSPDHAKQHDLPHDVQHELPHEGPIKTPKQLIWAILASFLIPIGVIILLVNYVDFGTKPAAGSDGLMAKAVAQRLQPVGRVEVRDAANPPPARTGDAVVQGQCLVCHGAGLAGAPKIGDVAAWAPRIATGFDALWNSALKGKNGMGAQGGGEYSDFEIARAVVHMTNQSGGKLVEPTPAAPAAAASAAN